MPGTDGVTARHGNDEQCKAGKSNWIHVRHNRRAGANVTRAIVGLGGGIASLFPKCDGVKIQVRRACYPANAEADKESVNCAKLRSAPLLDFLAAGSRR